MKRRLLIRADGNAKIGIGHIMRSMTIATAFKKHGFECFYVSSSPVNREIFERYGFSVTEVNYPYDQKTMTEAEELCRFIQKKSVGFVLIDGYYIGNDYLSLLRRYAAVICINSTRKKLSADFVINENIAGDREYFDSLYLGSGTKLLLGTEYTPVRQEFSQISYSLSAEVNNVLITTGGGDQYNFMTQFLEKIKNEPKYAKLHFTFISGACNDYYEELCRAAYEIPNVTILRDVVNMSEVMGGADLAISTGGTTVLELAAVGVPTIGMAVAADQEAGLNFMHNIGMLKFAGKITDADFWNRLFVYFDKLLADAKMRQNIHAKGRHLIDGKGAERIFREVVRGRQYGNR